MLFVVEILNVGSFNWRVGGNKVYAHVGHFGHGGSIVDGPHVGYHAEGVSL